LPCKYFYDTRGSELFERITTLPEYYPTRVETQILRQHASEIAEALGEDMVLAEFGSGASRKTRILLDAIGRLRTYIPMDISASALGGAAAELRARYPSLDVRPLEADYTGAFELPLSDEERELPVSFFFPGSTIGNFEPEAARDFLASVRRAYGRSQRFLIGVDRPKERAVLEAAYDDRAGVTAAFNRNLLSVVNARHGASFDPEAFAHRAVWREREQRVEMHLVSRGAQTVRIGPALVELADGEPIVTEHCYKYSVRDFARLARQAGFGVARVWTDPEHRFSVYLLLATSV